MGLKLYADEITQTNCCGLFEVSGLQAVETKRKRVVTRTVYNFSLNKYEEVEEEMDYADDYEVDVQEEMKVETEGDIKRGGRAFYATTTSDQRKEIKALKRLGFKKLTRWQNSNTGNYVTMWFKVKSANIRKKVKKHVPAK